MRNVVVAFALVSSYQPAMAAMYNPQHVVVIDADAVRQVAGPEGMGKSTHLSGLWTPTPAQADAAYAAFILALKDPTLPTSSAWARSAQLALPDQLDDYRINISGVTPQTGSDPEVNGRPGQQMIDLHGMCAKDVGEDWRLRGLPIATNGGLCVFSARYDPQADKIIFFYFAGY